MGAGRKRSQPPLKEKSEASWTVNCSVSARNLRKSKYGAVIFGCKHMTFQECMRKQLFGLPAGHFSYVKNVTPGMILFLFNYSDRKLHGIFEAVSPGGLNIDPYAWTTDAGETTPYPAQVRVRVQKRCRPLSEEEFRPIISENYYEELFFWFELDHQQAGKLTELFLSSPPPPPCMLAPHLSTRGDPNTAPSAAPSFERKNTADRSERAVCDDMNVDAPQEMAEITGRTFTSFPVGNAPHPQKTWSSLFKKVGQSSRVANYSDGVSLHSEASTEHDAKDMHHILAACAQDSVEHEAMDQNLHTEEDWSWETESDVAGSATEDRLCEMQTDQHVLADGASCVETEGNARILSTEELQLPDSQTLLLKLMHDVGHLKGLQLRQDLKIYCLEQELAESKLEMLQLRNKNNTPTSRPPSSSNGHFEEAKFDIFKFVSESDDCILVVGGYDGGSWLSDLSSFSPSHNLAKRLTSMTSIRAYASAAKVNGELFLLGGKHGNIWSNTVESYNPASNQWFRQPSLNQNKERLAALSTEDKLFAIGGGSSIECFAEVEMLDPSFGKWMWLQPMQHKRFAPAVANINKTLYAVGGYDGSDYLKSVERFDLREQKWTEIGSMGTKRGCHSVVALNEKIYALGGYDGKKMVSTVEVFDPRVNSWMMGESMQIARGYFGAVVMGEKIYVIGGVKDNDDILESIECYKEGHGWQLIDTSSIGKRCFFSALPL